MATLSHRLRSSFTRRFSSTRNTQRSGGSTKVPTLYTSPEIGSDSTTTTLQLLSWGRGASGQLGGGIEEIRMYPSRSLTSSFAAQTNPSLSPRRPEESTRRRREARVRTRELCLRPQVEPAFRGAFDSLCRSRWVTFCGFNTTKEMFLLGVMVDLVRLDIQFTPENSFLDVLKALGTLKSLPLQPAELIPLLLPNQARLGPGRGPNEGGGLSVPSKVKALSVPVASVTCGGFFTMALTQEGQLWNWGANSNYELGRGDNLGGWEPMPVPSLEGVRITQIACGGYHSLALTKEGKVLSWGHGGHGQLGNASLRNQKVPTEIEALADKKIVFIACGGSSSAAITGGGELWMWGNAKDFQLGVPGLPEIQTSPVQVNFLTEEDELGPHKVISVSIGASHALCLVSRSH
ncbi:hypothetical protein Rs2_14313 [Raphanus sativus]|nr:hypothetical protein Rs2_14313 [Raphanus sativus]